MLGRKTGQEQVTDRIVALERQVAELQRQMKGLDLEWSDTYEKFRRLLARLSKREQRAQDDAGDTNGSEPRVQAPSALAARLLGLTGGR